MAFSPKQLIEGEHIVISTRTHGKTLIVPIILGVVVVALAGIAAAFVPDGNATLWYAGIALVALVLLAWLVLPPLLRWYGTTYTVTNRRLIRSSGLVSKEGRSIPLNRISGVDFRIDATDRLFGCGTLIVSDASTNGQIELTDVPDVAGVQRKVAEELSRLGDRPRADDGA